MALPVAGWHGEVRLHGSVMPGWKRVHSQKHGGRQQCPRQQLSPNFSRHGTELVPCTTTTSLRNVTLPSPSLRPDLRPWAGQGCWEWGWLLGGHVSLVAAGSKKLLDPLLSVWDGEQPMLLPGRALWQRGENQLCCCCPSPSRPPPAICPLVI